MRKEELTMSWYDFTHVDKEAMQRADEFLSKLKDMHVQFHDDGSITAKCNDISLNCLTCSNSFSEETDSGDVLHCVEHDGKIVNEEGFCEDYN